MNPSGDKRCSAAKWRGEQPQTIRERRELWRQRIAEQKASGKTVRSFCREQKVSEYSFYWWRREIRSGTEQPVRFALAETTTAAITETHRPRQAEPQMELILITGERLHMPADADTLRWVLGVLREQGPVGR